MVNAWERPVDTADLDEKITNLRMRTPARLKFDTGLAAKVTLERATSQLPDVEKTLRSVALKEQAAAIKAELDADRLDRLYEDVHGQQKLKTPPRALRVPKGTPKSIVRRARARQLAQALVGSGDLSRPWGELRRIGTAGYHDAHR